MMTSFFDKILIYCFGAIAIFMNNLNDAVVAYLLSGILILGIFQLLEDYDSLVVDLVLLGIFIGMLIAFNALVIYVPLSSDSSIINAYKGAENWSSYKERIKEDTNYFGIDDMKGETEEGELDY
jgi:hypothetical protein